MKGYLLDTDIVVFILRNHFKAVNRLKELSPSEIYISEVTERYRGQVSVLRKSLVSPVA